MADIKEFIVKQAPAIEKNTPIDGRTDRDGFAPQRRATRNAVASIPKKSSTFLDDYGIIVDKIEQYRIKDPSFKDFLFSKTMVAFKVILKYNNSFQGSIPPDLDLSTLQPGDRRFSGYRWFIPQSDEAGDRCRHLHIGNKILVKVPEDPSDTAGAKQECFYVDAADSVNNIIETNNPNQQVVDSPSLFTKLATLQNAVDNFWKPPSETQPETPIPFKNPAAPSFKGDNFIINGQKVSSGAIKVKNFIDNSDVDTINTASRKRKFRDVRQFLIHETNGGGTANQVTNILFNRTPDRLSVHLVCDVDGIIWQYFDLATEVTFHASTNSAFSVGIEVISPFNIKTKQWPDFAKKSPWTGNKPYYLPNLAQCESIKLLTEFLANDSGLAIPLNFLNFQDNIFRWDYLGEFTKNISGKKFSSFANPKSAGILTHHSSPPPNNHADGSFLVLYSWLRIQKKLSDQEAYKTAINIIEGTASLLGKEVQADVSKYLVNSSTEPAITSVNKPLDQNAPIPQEGELKQEAAKKTGSEPRNFPFYQFKKVELDFAKKIKSNIKLGSKYIYIREDIYTSFLEIKQILNYFGCSLTLNAANFDIETRNISYLQRVGLQINLNKDAGLTIDGNVDTDEYILTQDKMTLNKDFYKFNVWARVYSESDEHESGTTVYEGELDAIDITKSALKRAKPEIKTIRGRFINLTEIFKKYNFHGVYGHQSFYLNSFLEKANWWVFENHNSLIKNKTTYGEVLSKTYKNNGEQVWLESNKIWDGEKFIG